MFQNPFSFEGRIRRSEYALSYIAYFVFLMLCEMLASMLNSTGLLLLFYIPGVWFMIAQSAKRCHDRGNSGWYQLIPFYQLFLIFGEGEEGGNEYGPNPKTGRTDVVEKAEEEPFSHTNAAVKPVELVTYTYKCSEGELIVEQEFYQPNKGESIFLNGVLAPTGKYKIGFMNYLVVEDGKIKDLTMS